MARRSWAGGTKCLLVFGLLCLASFVTISPFKAYALPELVLSPQEGYVGDTITVQGTGFAALTDVTLLFSGDEVPMVPEVVTADELGAFSAEFEVPYFTSAGTVVVEAMQDLENSTGAVAEFTVVNTPPEADELPTITLEENESEVIGLTANDDNGDTLALIIVDEPAHGSLSEFDEDTGEVVYTPDDGYNGVDSFSFKANDGTEDSQTRIVNITISGTNDIPVAFDESVELNENSKKKITLEASDADDDSLSYAIVSDPDHGNLTGSPPILFYEPYEGYSGADSFRFTASDSNGVSNVATVSIFVIAQEDEEYESEASEPEEEEPDHANSKPVAFFQSVEGFEDVPINIVLSGDDPDGDTLSFEIIGYPLYGEIANFDESGELTFVPISEYSGSDSFSFIAKDDKKQSKEATVSILISAVNDPPKPVSMNVTAVGGTANITLSAYDAEGDMMQFAIYGEPANGDLVGTAPDLYYVARPGFAGVDKFLFTVTDNRTETWIAVVSILVEPEQTEDVDDEPVADVEDEPVADSAEPPSNDSTDPGSLHDVKDDSEESTTKARADRSNVIVLVDWDHKKQDKKVDSTLHLKFAEVRTRETIGSHIWYDLVMLDEDNKEILRKHDLVALNSEDIQHVTFPANGTYHFEVNVKGLIDKSSSAVTRNTDYTGKALGTVVVPEFEALGILLTIAAVMSSMILVARRRSNLGLP